MGDVYGGVYGAAPSEPPAAPVKIITASVAASRFHVSTKTIQRAVKEAKLKDHRAPGHERNATLLVDENEVANKYPRK